MDKTWTYIFMNERMKTMYEVATVEALKYETR